MHIMQSRRDFLAALSAAGAASVLGARGAVAENPPETTTIRLRREPGFICSAPTYIAEELLRAEGFSDIHYVPAQSGLSLTQVITRGEIDFALYSAASAVFRLADLMLGAQLPDRSAPQPLEHDQGLLLGLPLASLHGCPPLPDSHAFLA
jgi:hypothetical protein